VQERPKKMRTLLIREVGVSAVQERPHKLSVGVASVQGRPQKYENTSALVTCGISVFKKVQ
jgi:hypothetical protein